jgi:hypothetical protein
MVKTLSSIVVVLRAETPPCAVLKTDASQARFSPGKFFSQMLLSATWMPSLLGSTTETHGRAMESGGRTTETGRATMEMDGKSVETDVESMETDAEGLETGGECMETRGETMETGRETMETDEKTVETGGETVETRGRTLETGGKRRSTFRWGRRAGTQPGEPHRVTPPSFLRGNRLHPVARHD